MRLLFTITIPVEPFATHAKAGTAGQKLGAIIAATKPESIYFTGSGSGRGAVVVYNAADKYDIPALAEPWLLGFNATIDYNIAITPEELSKADLDGLVKKWA